MFEMLLCSGGSPGVPEVQPGFTGSKEMLGKINRIYGTFFDANDVGYMYGGHDTTFSPNNDIFYIAATGDIIRATDIGLGSAPVRFPKAFAIGTKAYVFGTNGSNTFSLKIIDLVTKTSQTIDSAIAAGVTPSFQLGLDYNPTLGKFFMKYRGSAVLAAFTVSTGTFERITLTGAVQAFIDNEYLVCGERGVYTFGGWTGTTANLRIHKAPMEGGAVVEHGLLSGAAVASYNQGYCVVNRHAYYAGWVNGRVTFFIIDPENKREVASGFQMPGTVYRNIPSIGRVKNTIVYTGGTSIPVGSSSWQTDNRQNTAYQMTVNFDLNPPYTPPAE